MASYTKFDSGIRKADPDFICVVYRHFLSTSNRLEVIQLFRFGWDSPIRGTFLGFLGVNDPQDDEVEKNTCKKGTSLGQDASFEPLCVRIGQVVWAVG